jgi:hypothetical protein
MFKSPQSEFLSIILGSRGPGLKALWPLHYLMPPSEALTINWSGQLPLTRWQNTTITALLMVHALALAVRRGYSPVSLFSAKADVGFVAVLRKPWNAVRG